MAKQVRPAVLKPNGDMGSIEVDTMIGKNCANSIRARSQNSFNKRSDIGQQTYLQNQNKSLASRAGPYMSPSCIRFIPIKVGWTKVEVSSKFMI